MSRALWLALCVAACTGGTDAKGPVDSEPSDDTLLDSPATDSDPLDTDCADADGDGAACDDCADDDASRAPGLPELCNGRDDDCDERLPEVERLTFEAGACEPCSQGGFWPIVRDAPDGEDLWARLALAVRGNGVCDYSDTAGWMMLTLDKLGGEVECVYTGERVQVGDERPSAEVMNTEHTWPRSLGAGDGLAECDLHHLFPTLSEANNRRANYPFRTVAGAVSWTAGGSKLGLDAGGATVFEPRDQHKGDVARALFYMALRYGFELDAADGELYRSWHAADPALARDYTRSLTILDHQGNSNPFVLCPTALGGVSLP